LAPMIGGQRFMDTGSMLGNNIFVVAVAVFCVVIAGFAHKYIEMKGYELGKRVLGGSANAKTFVGKPAASPMEPRVDRVA